MKKLSSITVIVLLLLLMTMLCGCSKKSNEADTAESILNDAPAGTNEPVNITETKVGAAEELSDEEALSAIRNYCFTINPNLDGIVKAEEYPTYWEIVSGDEHEIVVLFRSYTGALVRYYIDRTTGDTHVTEYVPGVTPEEEQTDESFNVKDYISVN